MGKKAQGTIGSFFQKRSAPKRDDDASPNEPSSKKRRSLQDANPDPQDKELKKEGNTVDKAEEVVQLDWSEDEGGEKRAPGGDAGRPASRRTRKRIVIEDERDDEDDDGGDDLVMEVESAPASKKNSPKSAKTGLGDGGSKNGTVNAEAIVIDSESDLDAIKKTDGKSSPTRKSLGKKSPGKKAADSPTIVLDSDGEVEGEKIAAGTPSRPKKPPTKKSPAKKSPGEASSSPSEAIDLDRDGSASDEEADLSGEDFDDDPIVITDEAPKKAKAGKDSKSPKKAKKKKQSTLAPLKSTTSFQLTSEATWAPGKPVPYKYLADIFAKVEAIKGRLAIQAILSDIFRVVIDTTPEDLVPVIYLAINKLAASHEGVELGVGEGIIFKALATVTGRSVPTLKMSYKEIGDLGDMASENRATQKSMFPPPPLTVRKVFEEFKEIANMSGKNTGEMKKSKIVKMLVAASKMEAKYLTRGLVGKLRINLADKTVITSLATAMVLREENADAGLLLKADGKKKSKLSEYEKEVEGRVNEASKVLQGVYSQLPVWEKIVPEILRLNKVDDELKALCKLAPGVPVAPMLAKPTKSISEVLDRFAETKFTCEFKYDGERAQVHRLEDGTVKIFSRNAENLTEKYPDLVASLPLSLKEEFKDASFIIDCESTAYDVEKRKILPFQMLQGRKRKDVSEESVTVKVCVFAFDILYFNGESLLHKSLEERRTVITENFSEKEGVFKFATGHDSKDSEEILTLLNESIKAGCEGLMVKALEGTGATYEPANRSQNWLKVKKDYLEGCGDTLDLVPIGGYAGRGKRSGLFGAFLLACHDPETGEYQSICKIGTGFSDEALEEFNKYFKETDEEGNAIRLLDGPTTYYSVPGATNLQPDFWFKPSTVWEVLCADLSVSPQHMAAVGRVDPTKGIALRFPRFLRIRDDKKIEEATSAEQVAEFYLAQSAVANKG